LILPFTTVQGLVIEPANVLVQHTLFHIQSVGAQ
jgi:hypothetical protein